MEFLIKKQKPKTMKKLLSIVLMLLTVGSFTQELSDYQKKRAAQNTIERSEMKNTKNQESDTAIRLGSNLDINTSIIAPTPSLVFYGANEYSPALTITWSKDSLKILYNVKVDHAAELFFNHLVKHYSNVMDSLKNEIKIRDNQIFLIKTKDDIIHSLSDLESVLYFQIGEIEHHTKGDYYLLIPLNRAIKPVRVYQDYIDRHDPHLFGYYVKIKRGEELFISRRN